MARRDDRPRGQGATPSAASWAAGKDDAAVGYGEALASAVRCPDPLVRVHGSWLVRRLAPDCSRIELATLSRSQEITRLLTAMGRETANVHVGTTGAVDADRAKSIRKDFKHRDGGWLRDAAGEMLDAMLDDWEQWRNHAGLSKGGREEQD